MSGSARYKARVPVAIAWLCCLALLLAAPLAASADLPEPDSGGQSSNAARLEQEVPRAAAPPVAPPIAVTVGSQKKDKAPAASGPGSHFDLYAGKYGVHAEDDQLNAGTARIGRPGSMSASTGINSAGYSGYAGRTLVRPQAGATTMTGGAVKQLSRAELRVLSKHEVVLIVDQSGSMETPDCSNHDVAVGFLQLLAGVTIPGSSRWEWCLQQAMDFSRQTQEVFRRGITVVFFSDDFRVFPGVTLNRLPLLFNRFSPHGSTSLSPALGAQLDYYLRRRSYTGGNLKPLLIGIITDGCPNSKARVVDVLERAAHQMRYPGEITVVFFMIGNHDIAGNNFVSSLSPILARSGARFKMVKAIPFARLKEIGLARALASTLQ